MQGRGLKLSGQEQKKLQQVQQHAMTQMRQLSSGNSILGTKKRGKAARVHLNYGEGTNQDDEDGNISLTRLDCQPSILQGGQLRDY